MDKYFKKVLANLTVKHQYTSDTMLRLPLEPAMNTFKNRLQETLPDYFLGIKGTKAAERGWCGIYNDGHSVSPKNACRKLGRTSPLHLKTGWGGNSIAQSKEHDLKKPDSLARSGCDVPVENQTIFSAQPCAYGSPCWWTKYADNK
jgi:hypothetical protein